MSKHTHRAHCQVCGAQQAVNNETGMLAKHGYTVEHGFFEGECPGSHNLPIEVDHTMTDNIIDDLSRQADRIEAQIAVGIKMVTYRYEVIEGGQRVKKMTKLTEDNIESVFAELGKIYYSRSWEEQVERYEWTLKRQVTFLRGHCDMMTDMIAKRHGADMIPVERVERQSKQFADRTEAKAWLDSLKAEGWTGRIQTNMRVSFHEVGRYVAQARRTV